MFWAGETSCFTRVNQYCSTIINGLIIPTAKARKTVNIDPSYFTVSYKELQIIGTLKHLHYLV